MRSVWKPRFRYVSHLFVLLNCATYVTILDHGLEVLSKHVEKTTFPWLMSNVVDNETGRPLGGGKITQFFCHNGIRVGFIGLVEKEWLDTLPTIDPTEVTYIDYVKAGNQLAEELINEVRRDVLMQIIVFFYNIFFL